MPLANKRKAKKPSGKTEVRHILICTLLAMGLIAFDVFSVSVRKVHMRSGYDLSELLETNNNIYNITDTALRGSIYDRNGVLIAQDSRTYDIICILNEERTTGEGKPAYITDIEETAKQLSDILNVDAADIYNIFAEAKKMNAYQTELGTYGRQLSQTVKDRIEALGITGIEFRDSIERVYPNGTFASNLIGYAQKDEEEHTVGKMGLEQTLNSYLQGKDGHSTIQTDKNGIVLPGMISEKESAQNGNNVYLTLDAGLQTTLEESMLKTVEMFDNVTAVWGGAMEIHTGKVLAWGQWPSFDPNTLEITQYNNIGTQLPYEPGSTLKTFTWAAAINEGKYDGDATTDGDSYCYVSDQYNNPVRTYSEDNFGCIFNAHQNKYGSIDYDHGLIYSLNTVSAAVQNENIDPDTHLAYLRKFGFFSDVDTDGIAEHPGYLNFVYPGDKVSLSYGQGSTVTMLQLFQAYSAVFSDGTMVKPYFVESIKNSYDNTTIYQAETQVVGNPITAETAEHLQSILYRVVNDDDGTAKGFVIPECKMIGKTGTTQVAKDGMTYEQTNITINSIMAALPADNPQILVYYAFQCDYDGTAGYRTQPQVDFLRKVAITYGFSDSEVTVTEEGNTVTDTGLVYSTMPELINHSVEYAKEKLTGTGTTDYYLGTGTTVVSQYPKAGDQIHSGDRLFLVTDKASFTIPDLTGWTRSDVMALWNATGYRFTVTGSGKVVSQSIPAGTTVNKGTEIAVYLE